MRFIEVLVKGAKRKSPEIGAARVLRHFMATCGCHVTTIERTKNDKAAFENIKKSTLKDRIDVRQGDAAVLLPQTEGSYDLIFWMPQRGNILICCRIA